MTPPRRIVFHVDARSLEPVEKLRAQERGHPMTFAYSTGPRRRLVLGPPQAQARLCVPIPREVYDAVAALPERDQGLLVQMVGEFLGQAMDRWLVLGLARQRAEAHAAQAREAAAETEAGTHEPGEPESGL